MQKTYENKNPIISNCLKNICSWLFFVSTIFIVGVVLWFCNYGIDFTDESFYLAWIDNPFIYKINIPVSFFGFIYHPIYLLVDGDITTLRQANIILTYLPAWVLSYLLIRKYWHIENIGLFATLSLSAAIGTLSLINFGFWLVTPNYNTLTFQALMLTCIGLFLAQKNSSSKSILGWSLIGIGGWLTFMAKPSSAALLAPCVFLCLLFSKKTNNWLLLLASSIATVLILLSGLYIDGSISIFIQRIIVSIETLDILGSGQQLKNLFRIDSLRFNNNEKLFIIFSSIFVIIGTGCARFNNKYPNFVFYLLYLLLYSAIFFIFLSGTSTIFLSNLILFTVLVSCFFIIVCNFRALHIPSISNIAFGAFLLALPYIYAFGTNGNYWTVGANAGLFWGLAAIVLMPCIIRSALSFYTLSSLVLLFQIITTILLNNGIEKPYRQPHSLRQNAYPFDIRNQGNVILAKSYFSYLSSATRAAEMAGLHSNMDVIDLTGRSPGILYSLKVIGLGQPWMVGGYPGSGQLATRSLDTVSCRELANAWLLEEPNGPRRLSFNVLQRFGAHRESDYEVVGTFSTPPYAGGHDEAYIQNIVKPTRPYSVALTACLESRNGEPSTITSPLHERKE